MVGYNSQRSVKYSWAVKEIVSKNTRDFRGSLAYDGVKRLLDVSLAVLGTILAAPLAALIAAAVRIFSSGPVIFSQMRLGENGRSFTIYKFRTLPWEPERDSFAESGDPRWMEVTPPEAGVLGGALRRTGLDELPQLWNVLRGEMSMVGPRPERPNFVSRFRREHPGYRRRMQVKPGITGWAQIHGLRGRCDIGERLRFDLYYLKHRSLWLDLRILLLTPFGLLRHPGDRPSSRDFAPEAEGVLGAD